MDRLVPVKIFLNSRLPMTTLVDKQEIAEYLGLNRWDDLEVLKKTKGERKSDSISLEF